MAIDAVLMCAGSPDGDDFLAQNAPATP